jgi:hypothetical protein
MGFEKTITIDDEYSITKDYRSWNLIYKKNVPHQKDPTKEREHYEVTYHITVADALRSYVDKKGKKAGSIPDLIQRIEAAADRVEKLCNKFPSALSKEFRK